MTRLKKFLALLIKIVDFLYSKYDKLKSDISNSRIGNFIKEFLGIGTDYPSYLFCDETQEYVHYIEVKESLLGAKEVNALFTTDFEYALNFQKTSWLNKRLVLKMLNEGLKGEKTFRWKNILSF